MIKHEGATELEEIALNAENYSDAFSECSTELALQLNEILYDIINDNEVDEDYGTAFDIYKEELECRF